MKIIFSKMDEIYKREQEAEGGIVGVILDENDVTIVTIRNKGKASLSIRDALFDQYSTSSTYGGSGIGTYSARLVARTHGDDILVDTSVSGETSVIVSLPKQSQRKRRSRGNLFG